MKLSWTTSLEYLTFHSMALDRLPGVYGPEDINIAVIDDRQIRMDAKVEHLTSSMADFLTDNIVFTSQSIGDVTKSVDKLNSKFIELSDGMQLLSNWPIQYARHQSFP